MASSQSQVRNINGDHADAARVALKEPATVQKNRVSSASSNAELGGSKESGVRPADADPKPAVDVRRPADFQNGRALSLRRSVVGRSLRIVAHGLIVFVIVGAALAWRSSDNNTKATIKAWANSLPGVSFVGAITSPDAIGSSAPASVEGDSELRQKLATISGDLAAVQRILEQVVEAQKHMAQDIASLQSAQQAINQKSSSLNVPGRTPPRKSSATGLRSETLVERNSGASTTAPPQPPLELH
jgi:hypothetical protein